MVLIAGNPNILKYSNLALAVQNKRALRQSIPENGLAEFRELRDYELVHVQRPSKCLAR